MIGGGSPLSIFPNGPTNVNALWASSCGNGGRKGGGESHPNAPPDQELSQLLADWPGSAEVDERRPYAPGAGRRGRPTGMFSFPPMATR